MHAGGGRRACTGRPCRRRHRIHAIPYTQPPCAPFAAFDPRELPLALVCGAVAGALVAALLTFVPLSGDAPSHLFQTWLYRHGGFQVWNNLWYAGRYEFVSYSVLYYPLAALTGELPVLVVAAAALAASFAVGQPGSGAERRADRRSRSRAPRPSSRSSPAPTRSPPAWRARPSRCSRCSAGAGSSSASAWSAPSASRRSRSPCCWRSWPACCSAIRSRSSPHAGTGRRSPWSSSCCSRACSRSGPSPAAASIPTT